MARTRSALSLIKMADYWDGCFLSQNALQWPSVHRPQVFLFSDGEILDDNGIFIRLPSVIHTVIHTKVTSRLDYGNLFHSGLPLEFDPEHSINPQCGGASPDQSAMDST